MGSEHRRNPTILDVAQRAGVSVGTVSATCSTIAAT